jgi:hypothetical protein
VLSSTTAANRRPNIDETTIFDEDLQSVLPALTSKSYTIYNLTGASVGAYALASGDIIPLSTNNPYYNSFTTPNWGQTLLPANSVATIWIYAVPVAASAGSQAYRYLFVQPQWFTQATNSSAGALNTAIATENLRLPSELNLGSLTSETPELVCIGKIIIDFTTNWSLRQVTLITGNKFSQIGSPSGNFLSTIATDTTLTGSGTGASPLVVANPVTPQTTGFTISAGTTPKTLTVPLDASVSGTNTGDNAGVTSVSGTAPVVSSGGNTPVISMAAATASVNGYATSTQITKLDGIETGADVTDATNVAAAGAVMMSGALGTPSSGTVTNLTGTASININGTVGATTAYAGLFTSIGASGAITLNTATVADKSILYKVNGLNRWNFYTNNSAESGANAGSNFILARYADNGAYIGSALSVNRATGGVTIGDLSVGAITIGDAKNIVLSTTTGTKLGTAANQKLAFYNATPIVQPSGTSANATDLDTAITLVNNLKAKLVSLGLIA